MTQDEVDALAERMRAGDSRTVIEPDSEPKPKRRSPAKKRKGKPWSAERRAAASGKPPSLRAPIKAMLETVGGVWHMSELTRGHEPLDENYPTCGSVLLAQADMIATNLNTLAQTDPSVYRWLDRMLSGGGWGGVVLATWPVAQAVFQSHIMPRFQRVPEEVVPERVPEEAVSDQGKTWPPEPPS